MFDLDEIRFGSFGGKYVACNIGILHCETQGTVVSDDGEDFFSKKNILDFSPNQLNPHQCGSFLKN